VSTVASGNTLPQEVEKFKSLGILFTKISSASEFCFKKKNSEGVTGEFFHGGNSGEISFYQLETRENYFLILFFL